MYGDSSTAAAVMALATGYYLATYKRFVGSLRKTVGYTGHIILGLSPDVSDRILTYLGSRNVTSKQYVTWTYVHS